MSISHMAISVYGTLANYYIAGKHSNHYSIGTSLGKNGLQSNDKAVMKTTLLVVNSKIKTGEGSSSIKPLLTWLVSFDGKSLREDNRK